MKKVSTADAVTQCAMIIKKTNVEKGLFKDIRTFELEPDADLIR